MDAGIAKIVSEVRGSLEEVSTEADAGNLKESIKRLFDCVDALADAVESLNK
jgi:hypothetical protein